MNGSSGAFEFVTITPNRNHVHLGAGRENKIKPVTQNIEIRVDKSTNVECGKQSSRWGALMLCPFSHLHDILSSRQKHLFARGLDQWYACWMLAGNGISRNQVTHLIFLPSRRLLVTTAEREYGRSGIYDVCK